MIKRFLLILMVIVLMAGCSNNSNNDTVVTYLEAKEKIINEGAILIDVRTEEEYNQNHIDGAVLLTLDTIHEDSVASVVSSKDTPVIVYCQSGNRSGQAVEKLNDLGYENVFDLGSIDNWEE